MFKNSLTNKLTFHKSDIKPQDGHIEGKVVGGPITKLNAHQINKFKVGGNNPKGPTLGSKQDGLSGGDSSVS